MSQHQIDQMDRDNSRPDRPPCEACNGTGADSETLYTVSECAIGGWQVGREDGESGNFQGPIDLLADAQEVAAALNADPDANPCPDCDGTGDAPPREDPRDSDVPGE